MAEQRYYQDPRDFQQYRIKQEFLSALDDVQCHFLWELYIGARKDCPEKNIDIISRHLDSGNPIKIPMTLLTGYLHTQTVPPHYQKAVELFDGVMALDPQNDNSCSQDELKGYKYIALVNKLHTLLLQDPFPETEARRLLQAVQLENSELFSNCTKATIKATEALNVAVLRSNKRDECLKLYEEAIDLDYKNPNWWIGSAIVAEWLRKTEDLESPPNPDEELKLKKAIELTKETNASAMALLADDLFQKGRARKDTNENPNVLTEAIELYDKALALEPDNVFVLEKAGKSYSILGEGKVMEYLKKAGRTFSIEARLTSGIECLKKAVQLLPESSNLKFRLAQRYFCNDDEVNRQIGFSILEGMIDSNPGKHFWAEIEYSRLKKHHVRNFDRHAYLTDMKARYCHCYLPNLDITIKILENNRKRQRMV